MFDSDLDHLLWYLSDSSIGVYPPIDQDEAIEDVNSEDSLFQRKGSEQKAATPKRNLDATQKYEDSTISSPTLGGQAYQKSEDSSLASPTIGGQDLGATQRYEDSTFASPTVGALDLGATQRYDADGGDDDEVK